MTQDEAANILWWASKRHYPGDQMDITAEDIEAFDMAIAALRGERDTATTSWYSKKLYCDTCGKRIIGKKHNYCPMCGRKLGVEG